ncbi:uncharacterized protein LTR77_001014 [Saxophila tyrrhenica]|uniref:Uncharacterized protein n=1 Tax=Saxophila tyrrhenica TaxID=1690608 RepID=A0AAV9PPL9_9PEZI|nr:hypothetical protein LTR77_001014 [Saxophila tyrrhenica]
MDAGKPGDGGSPWRIKVTVEAEPQDGGSPAKRRTRTTRVPLKGGMSSSPVKRSSGKSKAIADDESELEVKRPQRKRKGTPIRRTVRASQETDSDGWIAGGRHGTPAGQIQMSQKLQEEMSSPNKRRSPGTDHEHRASSATRSIQKSRQPNGGPVISKQLTLSEESEDEDEQSVDPRNLQSDMTVANEDFTMISVDELESLKQNTSLIDNSGIEKSVASVSYMPSSPPVAHVNRSSRQQLPVEYPNIAHQAEEAKIQSSAMKQAQYNSDFQRSSNFAARQSHPTPVSNDPIGSESFERTQPQASGVEEAAASRSTVVNEDADLGADDDREDGDIHGEDDGGTGGELDIWAEEASRSLDEDQEQSHRMPAMRPESRPPQLEDLFSDQPLKPPRPEIPRTWRRTSGADFSYVDSPAHDLVADRKVSAASTDGEAAGSRSSAGVLTPPESSDDGSEQISGDQDGDMEEYDISLTQPDAADTQLHNDVLETDSRPTLPTRGEATSGLSDSESGVTSPDGEDTGVFWQRNLPNIYQRPRRPRVGQKQKAMDLSDLLNLEGSHKNTSLAQTKDAAGPNDRISTQAPRAPSRPALAGQKEKLISSPLRKSLFKSSRLGESASTSSDVQPVRRAIVGRTYVSRRSRMTTRGQEGADEPSKTEDSLDSFSSKDSDQRQILSEMSQATHQKSTSNLRNEWQGAASHSPHSSESSQSHVSEIADDAYEGSSVHPETETEEIEQEDDEEEELEEEELEEEEEGEQPSRSYEEHLNLESPQKISVKFNDSAGTSDLLAPKKAYPPLFANHAVSSQAAQAKSPPSVTLVGKKRTTTEDQAQGGIFSRLSTNFWSAVVRPSGPTLVEQPPEPEYPRSLRAHIRSRYGVLSDQHPWTMAHMRTLHRLLNSCTSGKSDSIVPKTGPLPYALENLIGKELQCVTQFRWKFTEQHAHVVDAFMQVLVPAHYIESMKSGEVDFIGDSEAKKYRGLISGRHGDDLVFSDWLGLRSPRGKIERDFVVKALGNCVSANILTAEKEAAEVERRRKMAAERVVWERRRRSGWEESWEESEG